MIEKIQLPFCMFSNQSVVHIINKKSSKSVRAMSLVRQLVLSTLQYNIMIKALHISGISKKIADSLSRCM
jgi:hypothetical protein